MIINMPKNKTITVITGNYFPEDTAIGLYTRQFAILLKEQGYQVKVITGFPNYPQWKIYDKYIDLPSYLTETIDGIEVIRYKQYVPEKVNLKGRVIMMLDLFYGTFSNLRKVKNTDLVICIVPFTISIFPALILSKLRKAKLWVHIQDFEFDLALDSGVIKENSVFLKIFKVAISTFERKMLNSAFVVSSISFSMLKKIEGKSKHKNPYFFPNWVSSEKINPEVSSQHSYINKDKFTLLYSGNIGEKQDWNLLINLCEVIDVSENIEIVIVGEGGFKDELKDNLKSFSFVKFFDLVPYEELNDLLCSANVHFLFQKSEVVDTIMPSKILGMMASKKPSIITGNTKSEVSAIINESGGGFYFDGNDTIQIYQTLLELKNYPEKCIEMGENSRNSVLNKFSEKIIFSNFVEKIDQVLA